MLRTIEVYECDFCGEGSKDKTEIAFLAEKHLCVNCLKSLYKDLEKEYHRVVLSEVPSRRGGYRKLGDFADT